MPTLLEAKDNVRTLSKKALDAVEDATISTADKKAALDKIEPEIKKWTDEVQNLELIEDKRKSFMAALGGDAGNANPDAGGEAPANKPVERKTFGQQVVESAQFKGLKASGWSPGGKKAWSTGEVELKALAEGTAGSPGTGYAAVATPTVLPGIVDQQFQQLTVADLFPSGVTDSPLLRYLVEVAVTNGAATVAELGLKPESAITFANVDEVLKKIATFLPVSDEMLEDFNQLRSYLDARLTLFVKMQEEVQLLRGDGTGTNIVGLLNRAGLAATIVKGTGVSPGTDNDMDAIYRQITAVRVTSFLEPDAIVIDPMGWQNITLAKDLNGQYYAGGPFMSATNPSLWGKRAVPTTAMPSLTALVGAFAAAAQVFRKGGLTVEASNSHADYFQRNQTAIRAEQRELLAVYRPGAFGTVSNL
jgi:HK97 family phage major capsid protein